MPEPAPRPRHAELALSIDLQTRSATPLPDTTMVDLNIWERRDLQRWIEAHPDLEGPNLLVITTEFDQWQIRDSRVADRLDILFLDAGGSLLVAELKRDAPPTPPSCKP
jgi:RecB family endonuclease NucS